MRRIRFWHAFPMIGGLCAGGGVIVAAGVTLLMPAVYESEMIVEVRPVGAEVEALEKEQGPDHGREGGKSPEYLKEAAEDLRGRDMLGKVVDALQLDRKWRMDRKQAVEELRESVKTSLLRDSSLVSIRVRDVDRRDACAIATEIGWHFVELRDGLARAELRKRLDKADRAIRDQEDKVEERRKILRTILRQSYEVDPDKVEWLKSDGSDTNEEALEQFMKRSLGPETYDDAKGNLDADLRDLYLLSWERAGILAGGGVACETVIYHEVPRVAEAPVWPDVRLNLMVGIGLGGVLSPVVTLWLSRRRVAGEFR